MFLIFRANVLSQDLSVKAVDDVTVLYLFHFYFEFFVVPRYLQFVIILKIDLSWSQCNLILLAQLLQ